MKIDFHIHTKYSKCSNIDPVKAVKRAEEKGLDAIVLLNHNLKPRVFKGSSKVKVIPGIEVSTKEGHVLVINTKKDFKKGLSAQEVINKAGKGSLVIIAHPFDKLRCGVGSKINELKGYHAIEVNARCLSNKFNNESRAFAKKNNIPLVAGSDSHFINEIGNAWTEVKAKTISEAIRKVKQGQTKTYIRKRGFWEKAKYHLKSMILIKKA
ncbi:MAG: PHP domain-containing protein [Candidatus Nanoarchaeia archaeon]|jgi:hypothetical protein